MTPFEKQLRSVYESKKKQINEEFERMNVEARKYPNASRRMYVFKFLLCGKQKITFELKNRNERIDLRRSHCSD